MDKIQAAIDSLKKGHFFDEGVKELAIEALEEKKKNRWIPIGSGQLPEEKVPVQVTYLGYNSGKPHCGEDAYQENGAWFWAEDDEDLRVEVIAWRPAREPYVEEKNNETVER